MRKDQQERHQGMIEGGIHLEADQAADRDQHCFVCRYGPSSCAAREIIRKLEAFVEESKLPIRRKMNVYHRT